MGTAREFVAGSGDCPEASVSSKSLAARLQHTGVQLQRLKVLGDFLGHGVALCSRRNSEEAQSCNVSGSRLLSGQCERGLLVFGLRILVEISTIEE